jgi:prolyl-tRNA editing enzyme YbaK/EbsC (Cys-tRNA(Pro) deacylase)
VADEDRREVNVSRGPLHLTAQRVQNALRERGSAIDVILVPDSTRTAAEAAAALGTGVAQIVKSLVFVAEDLPVIVLTSGSERVSVDKVRALVGASVKRADADTVRRLTGYSIGGIPPLAHDTPARILMDSHLYAFDVVWAAAGTPHHVFGIAPQELQRVAGAEIVDITE